MVDDKDEVRQVSIKYPESDDVVAVWANNLVVQHTPAGEFIVGFYAVYPPILIGDAEEVKGRSEAITSLPARCVAKAVVSAVSMPGFVSVLERHMKQFQSGQEKVDGR